MKTTTEKKAETTIEGWENIISYLRKKAWCKTVIAVECSAGEDNEKLTQELKKFDPILFINTHELFISPDKLKSPDVKSITDYFDFEKLQMARTAIDNADDNVIILGYGAHLVTDEDILIYVDSPATETGSTPETNILEEHKNQFAPYINYRIEDNGSGEYKMIKQQK